jgi:hypothetical protein
VLRPGKRPTETENAMICKRVLKLIRQHFPILTSWCAATGISPIQN